MARKKKAVFIHAGKEENGYYGGPSNPDDDSSKPTYNNLKSYQATPHAPSQSKSLVRHLRYMPVAKHRYLVEVWDSYCPQSRGRLGRQRSVLRARYYMKYVPPKRSSQPRNRWQHREDWKRYGINEQFHWMSENNRQLRLRSRTEINEQGEIIKDVKLTVRGQLELYHDNSRGDNDRRMVEYNYHQAERYLVRWRGKFSDKEMNQRWRTSGYTIRRTEDGTPLRTNRNYFEQDVSSDGYVIGEARFIEGRKHGVEKHYNKFGRTIDEKYFHHGVEIPRWMWVNPQDVKVEEILAEQNAEVRRAIIELQGFEVFLNRCAKAGMLKVVDKDPDPRVGELIRIKLKGADGWNRNRRDQKDDNVFMLLKVKDGTLPKSYVLRVPPNMKTARQANAWTWGKKESEYAPAIER